MAAIYGLGVVVSLGKLLIGFWHIKRLLNRAEALPTNLDCRKYPPQYVAVKDSSDPVYTVVEENPQFANGQDSMFRFLARNIQYPAEARQLQIQGTVYIGFIVEKDGSITNIKVKRNVPETTINKVKILNVDGAMTGTKDVKRQDHSCAKEAVRVISMMPKWKPGKSKGVPVRVAYTLPIKFKLE